MPALLHFLAEYGVAFVALNVFAEALGVPVPAVPTLIVVGALARDGDISAGLVVLSGVAAALAADLVWFSFGRRYGGGALRIVCRLSLSPDACVRQTESLFTRLGARALLVCKFVPGLSAVSTPLAGASGMPLRTFLLADGAGSLLWVGSSVLMGALLHHKIDQALTALSSLGGWATAVLLGLLGLYVLWRLLDRWRFRRAFAMQRIAPEELAGRLSGDDPPQIFDVRSQAARQRDPRAIPGARHLEMVPVEGALTDLPPDCEIVLYCT
ncbi:MAG TPA: VTT domain-containing protein [Candidatus Polarisedimenticolaceae bacterium]|nr:VTT domain-containing protein [Candidatus Polarisedimenticolaceae bacterium]